MPVLQPIAGSQPVHDAIRTAAQRTDTNFDYLLAQARVESALDPAARARTSSAAGLFQFTQATWLETIDQHGAQHGLGWAAAAIESSGGRAQVADPAMRAAILNLRFDPAAASLMAGEFARENAAFLENTIGRAPDNTELYLAHFLGADGARRFISAHDANPRQSAAALFPQAAGANRGVFYAGAAPRSLGEVREFFANKLAAAGAVPAGGASGGLLPPGGNRWPAGFAASSPAPHAASQALGQSPGHPPGRPSMAQVLASALGPISETSGGGANASGANRPDGSGAGHVARAYRELARFGL